MASPKRPRLSLKITTSVGPASSTSAGTSRRLPADPRDPTALNTLSNVYLTTIERSTQAAQRDREPLTAINTLQAFSLATPVEGPVTDPKQLRVSTSSSSSSTNTVPHVVGRQYQYPETPLTAQSMSPRPGGGLAELRFPSTMTATPPLSGTADSREAKIFTFSPADIASQTPVSLSSGPGFPSSSPAIVYRQQNAATAGTADARQLHRLQVGTHFSAGQSLKPPYTPSQARNSILRNSPLPPRTAIIPPSPRRSQRLLERAARRVGYNSPIEQEIITNKYTRSHIDLLSEDASPTMSPATPASAVSVLSEDDPLAFTANEVRDGGRTPGPFEVVRRRVAGSGPTSPAVSPTGIRKRKKKEKKRRWVWTIGQEDDDEEPGGAITAARAAAAKSAAAPATTTCKPVEDEAMTPMGPVPQITFDEIPTPSVESVGSNSACSWDNYRDPDVDMTDCSSVYSEDISNRPDEESRKSLQPRDADIEMKTPTEPKGLTESLPQTGSSKRDTPIPELNSRRDTPIPNSNRATPVPSLRLDVV